MNYKTLLKEIIVEIEKATSIVILRHRKPDPDALGSQLGLKELIKVAYPEKAVYVIGDMPDNLKYIGEMDEISLETFHHSLVIVTDCSTPSLINCPFEVNVDEVIKIDHHPNVTPYGKICYVDTSAASASEIIAEFAFDEETPFQMNKAAANIIYAGIIGDTGRFLYPSTTSKTFALVSKLIQYEVDIAGIADKMITKPLNINRMTGYIYEHMEVSPQGMASIVLTKEVLERVNATDQLASLVVSVPGTVEGTLAWSMYVEQEDGTFRVHLRSKGPTVNHIAQKFGGGGHTLACGIPSVTNHQITEIDRALEVEVSNFNKI